jgi:diguanylate cyclase (GGDEF)-like protein
MAGKIEKEKLLRSAAITRAYLRINGILELDKISRIYLRELIDLVDCEGCAVILIEGGRAKILAERGFSKTFGELEFKTDLSTIEHVVNTKQLIFTRDIQSSPAAHYIPYGCPINSLICTPIMVDKDVRGIIHLDSPKKNAFNKEDIKFTELLSKEMSIAFGQSFQCSHVQHALGKDELTGCFNHRRFDTEIIPEIARAKKYDEQLSLLVVDIDCFKKYNDFHGYLKGDMLQKKVTDVLASHIRAFHKIYRYGEEEFAILMADTNKHEAHSVARRLQKAIEQENFEGEERSQPNGKVTVSIGVATFPLDADNRNKLTEAADLALYRAKESGRNQVCVFSKEE